MRACEEKVRFYQAHEQEQQKLFDQTKESYHKKETQYRQQIETLNKRINQESGITAKSIMIKKESENK